MKRFKSESYHKRKVDKVIPDVTTFTVDGYYVDGSVGAGVVFDHALDLPPMTLVTCTVTVRGGK